MAGAITNVGDVRSCVKYALGGWGGGVLICYQLVDVKLLMLTQGLGLEI